MIVFLIFVVGWLVAWPILSRWYMNEEHRNVSKRTAENYFGGITFGFFAGGLWFGILLAIVIWWFVTKVLATLFFPELRKKKKSKSE